MLTVSKLNLTSQWVYRIESPKGQYFIDFRLDPASEYYLVEEARKLNSDSEVKKFEDGLQEAAIIAALKIPEEEIQSGNLAEFMRLQIDPKFTQSLFAFQFKLGDEKDKLIVTKAKLASDEDKEKLPCDFDLPLVSELNLPTQEVSTNLWTAPILIDYCLDEKTKLHLQKLISSCKSEGEIESVEKDIRSAVRFAAHKMVDNGFIYSPGGTKIKLKSLDLERNCKLVFIFTIINGKRLIVNQIRMKYV